MGFNSGFKGFKIGRILLCSAVSQYNKEMLFQTHLNHTLIIEYQSTYPKEASADSLCPSQIIRIYTKLVLGKITLVGTND